MLIRKPFLSELGIYILKINDAQEVDYEKVKITHIGFVDEYGLEGLLLLKSDDGREFHMHAFSGEVARHISDFYSGGQSVPTIYKMLEEICEVNELLLVKVKIYESGQALRANLYFTGKTELVLRNYRASDAIALAVFYKIPILVRKNLLQETMKV
jgi:hypothetical protein|tara:strand:- start:588 stop:1055 length:468 start_codon:yes stop_codon:yes gene_type:complete